jgi:hypothetical protein
VSEATPKTPKHINDMRRIVPPSLSLFFVAAWVKTHAQCLNGEGEIPCMLVRRWERKHRNAKELNFTKLNRRRELRCYW